MLSFSGIGLRRPYAGSEALALDGTILFDIAPEYFSGNTAGNAATLDTADFFQSAGAGEITLASAAKLTFTDPTLYGAYNADTGLITLAHDIGKIAGLHDGLGEFVGVLNQINAETSGAIDEILSESNSPAATVANASPLGFASMTQMAIAGAQSSTDALRSYLESRRYERGITGGTGVAAYFLGTGNFTDNGSGASYPVFDFDTFGGIAGVDGNITKEILLGVNAGYTNGRAMLHDGGGKITQDAGRITGYASMMFTENLYLDASVFGGFSSYDVKRETALGETKASPDGFDVGTAIYLGGVVPATKEISFTPYAGFEYTHAGGDAFTESGAAGLATNAFSQDSLRAKIGTGVSYLLPANGMNLRFSLNVAYAHEFLDTETDIEAHFAGDAERRKFTVSAATMKRDSIQVGPAIEAFFGQNMSLNFGYTFESDFDDRTTHRINGEIRARF